MRANHPDHVWNGIYEYGLEPDAVSNLPKGGNRDESRGWLSRHTIFGSFLHQGRIQLGPGNDFRLAAPYERWHDAEILCEDEVGQGLGNVAEGPGSAAEGH